MKQELPMFYTVEQACKKTGYSSGTIYYKIAQIPKELRGSYIQKIDGYNGRKQTHICEHQVNIWAAEHQQKILKKEPPIVLNEYKREGEVKEPSDKKLLTFKDEKLGSIRALEIEGEPWFVGKDVAKSLGYERADNAIRNHVEEEDKLMHQISALGQTRKMTIINESGLYALILSSKLPTAKQFKRWVTSEVLPSIRKHGGYLQGQEEMSAEELLSRALLFAQSKIEDKEKQIQEMEPKVKYLESITGSGLTMKATTLAKFFGMSAVEFNKLLNEKKVQYKTDGIWQLYRQYQNLGYALLVTGVNRNGKTYQNLEWTQEGKQFITALLARYGIYPVSSGLRLA